ESATRNRSAAILSVLGPADVEAPRIQLDLRPLQIAQLRGPQSMPIADQDHGRIPMPVPASLSGGGHQTLDLSLGQIFAGTATAPNWGKNNGWRDAADR